VARNAGHGLNREEAIADAAAFLAQISTEARPFSSREANVYGLTPRELVVLRYVATGLSDREIADALFISRHTATTHVSNILGKMGVGSRTAAASLAHQGGFA
jgi:DNA-binding NarL/FixJ family response regulator